MYKRIISALLIISALILTSCQTGQTCLLTVIDGNGGGSYVSGSEVTVTPDDALTVDKVFAYWTVDGAIVSEEKTYTFTLTSDLTVKAVYMTELEYNEKDDLFYTASVDAGQTKAAMNRITSGSSMSYQISALPDGEDWPYITLTFAKTVDITDVMLTVEAEPVKGQSWVAFKLYDGNGNEIADAAVYELSDGRQTIEIKKDSQRDYTAVGGIRVYLDNYSAASKNGVDIMLDNLKITPKTRERGTTASKQFTYTFAGGEAADAGFGAGSITYADYEAPKSYDTYEIFFANADGRLQGYAPIVSADSADVITAALRENVVIPFDADRLAVYKNGTLHDELVIDSSKLKARGEVKAKFASVSDIHMNYAQGKELWIHALNEFENDGVQYILISGDIGEKGEHYLIYKEACEQSGFTGLIFACIGNHDQIDSCREMFMQYAIYDGSTKTFVPIAKAREYFKSTYAGTLTVDVIYKDVEGGGKTYYYAATVNDNCCIFMDQMLNNSSYSGKQDNFSAAQIEYVSGLMAQYYDSYNLYICEHAPITELNVGFDPAHSYYGACLEIKPEYPNNTAFIGLLRKYTRAIWMSGHTHISFALAVCYTDREYDADGNLTDKVIAHSIHNGSTAQTRELDNGVIAYGTDFKSASQAYICYQFADSVLYEGHILKYRTQNPELDISTLTDVIDPTTSFYFYY